MSHKFFTYASTLVLLAGCTFSTPSDLPSEEVLRRAAEAGQLLDSAAYIIAATFTQNGETTAQGNVRLEGRLQDGGRQMTFTSAVDARMKDMDGEYTLLTDASVAVLGPAETYLKLDSLVTDPPGRLFDEAMVKEIAGKWLLLGSTGSSVGEATQSVRDPRLLRAQVEVVRVTKDHGIEDKDEGKAYHYDVELDTGRLVSYLERVAKESGEPFDEKEATEMLSVVHGTGEVWIDKETFFLREVVWDIEDFPMGIGRTLSFFFTAIIKDYNAAQPIVPPANAIPFNPIAAQGGASNRILQEVLGLPVR